MLNTDDSWLNPSKRAKEYLDKALEGDSDLGDLTVLNQKVLAKERERRLAEEKKAILTDFSQEGTEGSVVVDEARREAPVLEQVTEREKIRIVLFTKDATFLDKGSLSYQRVLGERMMFFEIHIVILKQSQKREEDVVLRPFDNVWMYQVSASTPWMLMYRAYKTAELQLVFSGGFRADIIIADDLFEAGLTAWYVAKRHGRPLQLHLHEDFFDPAHAGEQKYPALYEWSMWHLFKKVSSVRTRTEFQRQEVVKRNELLKDRVEVLPTYYNLKLWKDAEPSFNLHERYPKFKFIILHVSAMRPSSHSIEALIGAARLLKRYPSLGLVVVGNGPMRADLERQAIALGLKDQVEFEPMSADIISHMKTANVLIHLAEEGDEDDLILEAAVSKLPMVANGAGLAGQLFVDGESACLCKPEDITCIAESLNRYLNENQERSSFALAASDIVFERIEQDYGAYLAAYRDSVERGLTGVS